MWPGLAITLALGGYAAVLFYCLCLVRAGRDEDRIRERLAHRPDVAPERVETPTLVDDDATPESDASGEVRVRYHWNLFV